MISDIPEKRKLKELYESQVPFLEEINNILHRRLKEELLELGVHATVKTRVKSFESYYRKLLARLGAMVTAGSSDAHEEAKEVATAAGPVAGVSFARTRAGGGLVPSDEEIKPASITHLLGGSHLTDIIGIRIVCPFLDDIQVACSLVHRDFDVLEIEEKGARRSFREFGYQATHYLIRVPEEHVPEGLTAFHCFMEVSDFLAGDNSRPFLELGRGPILCEVQTCTLLQDAWSEVEHELIYKAEFSPLDEPLKRKLAALNANLTLSDIIFQEIREYQRELHGELFKRRQDFLTKAHGPEDAPARMPGSNGRAGAPAAASDRGAKQIDPSASIDELLLEALSAHNGGRHEEAVAIYTAVLETEPPGGLAVILLNHRGMAHFASSAYEQALSDFTRAIEIDSTNTRSFYYRASVHRALGDLDSALADLDRSLELNPFEFEALYARSRIERELGDFGRALADCDAALRIDPDSEEASAFRSLLVRWMGM